jgi:copper resistance protein B
VKDNRVLTFVTFDQLEGRTNGPNTSFRWDGEGWIGTDFNKFWFKSEGFVTNGVTSDGDHEFLYDRPIPPTVCSRTALVGDPSCSLPF